MAVLAVARVQVEINAADQLLSLAINDVEIAHVLVPDRYVGGFELDAVQRAGQRHRPFDGRLGREIFAQFILVDVVQRLFHFLLPVTDIPARQFCCGGVGAQRLRLEIAQGFNLGLLQFGDRLLDVGEEAIDVFRFFRHAAAQHKIGITGLAEQARHFMAQPDCFGHQFQIFRRAAIRECDLVTFARLAAVGIAHEGQIFRIGKAEQVIAVLVALGLFQIIVRQAFHFFRRERQFLLVVANVARKILLESGQPLDDDLHARLLFRRQRDAGIVEAVQNVLPQLLFFRRTGRRILDVGVNLVVLVKLGGKAGDLDQAGCGILAYFRVGRNMHQQCDRADQVFGAGLHAVSSSGKCRRHRAGSSLWRWKDCVPSFPVLPDRVRSAA